MGDPRANMPNVRFQYGHALAAARELSHLASVINDKAYAWQQEASRALNMADSDPVRRWVGGHSDTFQANLATAGGDAETISANLADLAARFADQWAKAWGEQDRINHARWAQAEKDDDGWFEDHVVELVYDEDTGPPPEDPETPSARNSYQPTRGPIHYEHEQDRGQVAYRSSSAARS
jgi:hypothetical protein